MSTYAVWVERGWSERDSGGSREYRDAGIMGYQYIILVSKELVFDLAVTKALSSACDWITDVVVFLLPVGGPLLGPQATRRLQK